MIQNDKTISVNFENNDPLNKHKLKKLNNYTVNLEDNMQTSTKINNTITCITIPAIDTVFLLHVDGFDDNENIKYKLLGKVPTEHFSNEKLTMVELSTNDKFEITNLKEIYRYEYGIGINFKTKSNKSINNFGLIYNICNVIVKSYICNLFSDLNRSIDVDINN